MCNKSIVALSLLRCGASTEENRKKKKTEKKRNHCFTITPTHPVCLCLVFSTIGNNSAPWTAHLALHTACLSECSDCLNKQFQPCSSFFFFSGQKQQAPNSRTSYTCKYAFTVISVSTVVSVSVHSIWISGFHVSYPYLEILCKTPSSELSFSTQVQRDVSHVCRQCVDMF